MPASRTLLLLVALAAAPACRSAYYGTMEAFGVHKRDILVDRVEEARDAQSEAKEQFADALEAFQSVQAFEGGALEELYQRLSREHERSRDRAEAVRARIRAVERVSEDLFDEWRDELGRISDPKLRQRDQEMLDTTRARYDGLIAAMKAAESRMAPVLTVFGDHVLFLKHNLNAQAIASLQGSLGEIESDVAGLIAEMERSIAEADAFLASLGGST